jgi:hypothetical protein
MYVYWVRINLSLNIQGVLPEGGEGQRGGGGHVQLEAALSHLAQQTKDHGHRVPHLYNRPEFLQFLVVAAADFDENIFLHV